MSQHHGATPEPGCLLVSYCASTRAGALEMKLEPAYGRVL